MMRLRVTCQTTRPSAFGRQNRTKPTSSFQNQLTHLSASFNLKSSRILRSKPLRHRAVKKTIVLAEQVDPARTEAGEGFDFNSKVGKIFETVSEEEAEFDALGESNQGDWTFKQDLTSTDDWGTPVDVGEARELLETMGMQSSYPVGMPERGIYCSRTLNLRSISLIGYDMDYTLVHYDVAAWEGRAYEYGLETLREAGCPVDGLTFDPDLVIRGLIVDKQKGNLVKADRFGYVKRAMHGTRMLSYTELNSQYGRELVDLRDESRWLFLNTLFSVSEAVLYMQMVDRLDQGGVLPGNISALGYQGMYRLVAKALFRAHVEGKLKEEIMQCPEKFVIPDPEIPSALLDQRDAGKKLLLITNSDLDYTSRMMSYAFDKFLPTGTCWRDLFDMVVVSARKPEFFTGSASLYQVVTEDGLMKPVFNAAPGGIYCGGSARMVEKALDVDGDEIIYVGDHIYTDVSVSKSNLRWRTCLILRELEEEVRALRLGQKNRERLQELMNEKELIGDAFNQLRLAIQRHSAGRPLPNEIFDMVEEQASLENKLRVMLQALEKLDEAIVPLLERDGEAFSRNWGYLSRAGLNDKSHLTRQIEKYADIYTSRVSNFVRYTPYMYFRSPSQSLAHHRTFDTSNPSGCYLKYQFVGDYSEADIMQPLVEIADADPRIDPLDTDE